MKAHFLKNFRVASLCTAISVSTCLTVAPAYGQEAPAAVDEEDAAPIIVTGSRIIRKDFTATSPIVTVGADLLEESSAINIEANLNKLPQFAPALTQFDTQGLQANANVTIGVATVSLRQLGANRNLVLIDGRRPTPINGSGVVDINTIPSAAVERVEVISGGASSTYGADAVGGVVNFILKKNFKGIALDGQYSLNERGDGAQYRVSALMGAELDGGRGNVMLGMEYYDRESVRTLDRPWNVELAQSPNTAGTEYFLEQNYISFPAAGRPTTQAVNDLFHGKGVPSGITVPNSTSFYLNGNNSLFLNSSTSPGGVYTPLFYGYDEASSGAIDGIERKLLGTGLIANNIDDLLLSSPQSRYSFFANGRYDVTDNISAFGQVSYASTETVSLSLNTVALGSLGTAIPHNDEIYTGNSVIGTPSSIGSTIGGITYTNPDFLARGVTSPGGVGTGKFGLDCPVIGGCTNSQVFPVPDELALLLGSRTGAAATQPFYVNLIPGDIARRTTRNHNQTYQMLLGLEGKIPGTDWTWEVFGSHGETTARTELYGYLSVERLAAVLNAPNYGYNSSFTGNGTPLGGNRNGASASCQSGLSPFTSSSSYTADCGLAVAVDAQLENRLTQQDVQANLQGGLFDLPYGQLRFALGAEYRVNKIRFHGDSAMTDGSAFYETVNGGFPQASTEGTTAVKEIYGEVLIPVLADLPFAKALTLELGYRLSDYRSVGTVSTYKFNGEYAPFDWLRFRGGYQKASRAPNLGELFTARTQTQTQVTDGDPCSRGNITNPVFFGNYSANPIGADSNLNPDSSDTTGNANAAQVEALCRSMMGAEGASQFYLADRLYPTNTGDYFRAVSSGALALKEEDATTYTIGAVITSPFEGEWLRNLRLAIDYYNVTLSGGISQENINAVFRKCFTPVFNPDYSVNDACSRIIRDSQTGEVVNVLVNYGNAGRVETAGVDVQLDWGIRFKDGGIGLPGRFSTNVQFTYLDKFATTADEVAVPLIDYAGTTGGGEVGTQAGSYRWKLFTRFNYAVGPATISLQWQHKPAIAHVTAVTRAGGTTITGAPAYDLFSLSGSYQINRAATIRFGVDNLFDRAPPLMAVDTSADPAEGRLPGGRYDAGNYDVLGRRFYIGAGLKF
ncbi:MAG TPA: TonB-dependent receptor [Sphingomonadaceae bacterium]|nr:TonB-dependent receptor [Sphingomonadaceae bacterium]